MSMLWLYRLFYIAFNLISSMINLLSSESVVICTNFGPQESQLHGNFKARCCCPALHWWSPIYYFNLLLTENEGRTGVYWPEDVAVRTSLHSVRTKPTEDQYSPLRLELARLVSSLLYGTRVMLVLNLPAFAIKWIHSLWPLPRQRSVCRNPDQERTNQSARSCLAI